MLPPMTDCLLHHLKQSNYKAFGWSHALEAMQDLGSPEGHNHKSTDTCKPSRANDMQVQDLLAQNDASEWQTMKDVGTPMV